MSDQLFGQSTWIKRIDHDRLDNPNDLIKGDSGTFYLIHRYEDGSIGPVTQNLTKMSISGDEIWNIKFENYPYHVFEGPAAILTNNDLIVSFLFEDSLNLTYNISRINPEGVIQWTVTLPFLIHQEIDYAFQLYKVIPIAPNDIRLFFRMNYYWEFDPPTAKNGYISFDSSGQEINREYFETNGEYQWPYNIIKAQDSHYVKVYRPTLGQLELLLRYDLLDQIYNQDWSFEIGPQDAGGGGPVCADANGNVYFTWNHDTTGNGSISHQLPSIFSLDKHGALRWSVNFGEDKGISVFYDIDTISEGRVIACGQEGNSMLSGGKYRTGWIVCIDTTGTKLWERRYILEETRDSGNNFYSVIESDDGGLILFGSSSNKEDGFDVYVLKTGSNGCLVEDCGLYNFISFFTATKDVLDGRHLFYHHLDNSILSIFSKETPINEELRYEIINLNGYILSEGIIIEFDTQIDISSFLPGLYFIRIYNESGKTITLLKLFNPN